MTNTNNFYGPVSQFNQVEGDGNDFSQDRMNQNFSQNSHDFEELSKLAKAIHLGMNPKKISSLKRELTVLLTNDDVPMTVKLKIMPLIKSLETLENDSAKTNPKIWEILRPYIGDAANLSTMASYLGEYGGTVIGILRKIFLFT